MKRPQRKILRQNIKARPKARSVGRKKFYPFGRGTKGYKNAEDYHLAYTEFIRSNLGTSVYYVQVKWMEKNGVPRGRIQRYRNKYSKNIRYSG